MRRVRIESLGASPPRRRLFGNGSVAHAVRAGRRCLKASRHTANEIGIVVNAGVHRDGHVCEPAGAVYVQRRLGINVEFGGPRTLAFDLVNGGCGMLSAAQVLASLLLAGEAAVGMVVAGEANSDRRPDPGFPYPPSGAAAILDIAPQGEEGFGTFAFRTRGEHADLFTSVVSLREKRGRLVLARGAGCEDVWLDMAREVVDEALERDGLSRAEVGIVVPAQISAGLLARLPEAIGVPRGLVADFTQRLPDTLSTSLFLAFHAFLAGRLPPRGTTALLLAFGSGLTVGAATYHFDRRT